MVRVPREVRPGRLATLRRVARLAGGDQIPVGVVAALHPRLHVVQRQLQFGMDLAAVDAAERVTAEDPPPATELPPSIRVGHVFFYTEARAVLPPTTSTLG